MEMPYSVRLLGDHFVHIVGLSFFLFGGGVTSSAYWERFVRLIQ
jgi:hypothetical protein